jgi:streptomycin 6-kinase
MLEIREISTYAEWFAALRDHVAKTCSQSSHRHPDQTAKEALGNKAVKRSLHSDLFQMDVLGAD